MADRIQQRRDTAARWAQYNPVLLEGEMGIVTDNPNRYKVGDGINAWNSLPFRGFDGTVVQEMGNAEDAVMSQKSVTDLLNEGYLFVGIASTTTQPITPKGKVFYLAFTQGTYSNFNNIVLNDLDIKVLYNYTDGKWYSMNLNTKNIINIIDVSSLYPTDGADGTDRYTLETAIAKIPKNLPITYIAFYNSDGNKEVYESQTSNRTNINAWKRVSARRLAEMEKVLAINPNNIEVSFTVSSGLKLKITAMGFLYLNKSLYKNVGYCRVNTCDLTITGTQFIVFSDTNESYTECTYGSDVYLTVTDTTNINPNDIVAYIVNGQLIGSNYPLILDILYKNNITEEVNEQINNITEEVNDLRQQTNEVSLEITGLAVREWDWDSLVEQGTVCPESVIPIAIPASGYISVKFGYFYMSGNVDINLYTKGEDGKYVKNKTLITVSATKGINQVDIATKVDITDEEYYLGITSGMYYGSAADGNFVLLANNGSYKGLLLSYYLTGDLPKELNSLSEQVTGIEDEIQEINDKLEELTLTEDNEQIEEKEYWVKVQGNTFDSSELYTANGASVSDNSVSLNTATSYVALNKIYWSNRRIHKFIVTPTTLGMLVINLAQNTSNAMYPTFSGGNWTSAFKIDFSNKKIYMGDNIEFDMSSMNIVAGRKYIIELKYIKRVFYVTITDFLNLGSYTATLDARDSNKNGGFKNTLIIQNQSGNYTVEQIETYEVANPTLVLFGDSVTEAIGRVGEGQNYSEIISEKIKSCTIIAQGGAGTGSWNNIFENEIKYIKPKYCSFHMGLNGGFNNTQLEKFITDCESIGTIPILNHVICTTQMSTDVTQETYNSILDGVVGEKGYMGYYGDIVTATNNDITSQSNYMASNAADGKFNIKKTAMSKDCFNTYTIAAGKTVIEDEEERVLDSPLEVIMDIHPKAAGHEVMADRYLKEVHIV